MSGGRLLAHSDGETDIEEEAMLQSTSLTIQSGVKAGNSSWVTMGTPYVGGDGSVYNNTDKHVVAHGGSEVTAQQYWWGSNLWLKPASMAVVWRRRKPCHGIRMRIWCGWPVVFICTGSPPPLK